MTFNDNSESSFRWLLDQWGLDPIYLVARVKTGFRWLLDQWGLDRG